MRIEKYNQPFAECFKIVRCSVRACLKKAFHKIHKTSFSTHTEENVNNAVTVQTALAAKSKSRPCAILRDMRVPKRILSVFSNQLSRGQRGIDLPGILRLSVGTEPLGRLIARRNNISLRHKIHSYRQGCGRHTLPDHSVTILFSK